MFQMFANCDINDIGTTTRYDALLDRIAATATLINVDFRATTNKYGDDAVVSRTLFIGGCTCRINLGNH